jgi:hypothetical protein
MISVKKKIQWFDMHGYKTFQVLHEGPCFLLASVRVFVAAQNMDYSEISKTTDLFVWNLTCPIFLKKNR